MITLHGLPRDRGLSPPRALRAQKRRLPILFAPLIVVSAGLFVASLSAEEVESPPKSVAPADPAVFGIELSKDDLEHWAFRPIADVVPPVPERDAQWVQNPIDAFVLQRLHEKGLAPSRPAADGTWLRRVSYDLVGLPPSPEQLEAFLNDRSADRRERVVDRLLADPGYGVRWGRQA